MCEYSGYLGCRAVILGGGKIFLKQPAVREEICALTDITGINFSGQTKTRNAYITIVTSKGTYKLSFLKENRDRFKELYNILLGNPNFKDFPSFAATKKVDGFLELHETEMKWRIPCGEQSVSKVFNYADVIAFELLEDGKSVAQGGQVNAIEADTSPVDVGVIGSVAKTARGTTESMCQSLRIKIAIADSQLPFIYIDFLEHPTQTNSSAFKDVYKKARKCLSMLQLIYDESQNELYNELQNKLQNENQLASSKMLSQADEILKFKNLLEDGIITPEQFEAKKKQIFGV